MSFLKVAAALLAMVLGASASAQNTQLAQAPEVRESVSAQWVIDLFAGRGFTAAIVESAPTHDILLVQSPAGGAFFVALRNCDSAVPKQCMMIQVNAIFDASGVTLSQVNEMMQNNFILSYAFLTEEGLGVIASKIFLWGGVTEDHIIAEFGGYFRDLDNLIDAITGGALATINFDADEEGAGHGAHIAKAKIGNLTGGELVVNAVGPNAAKFLTDAFSEPNR